MAKTHAQIQKEVKEYIESLGHFVLENKKGNTSKYYNTGMKGIADLLCLKKQKNRMITFNVCWIEIKTKNDKLKKDQIIFRDYVRRFGHYYFVFRSIDECERIFK